MRAGDLARWLFGHHQEKGITPAPSLQRGLPCPRPRALPSPQPQKLLAKPHCRGQPHATVWGAEGCPASPLGSPPWCLHEATGTLLFAPRGRQRAGRVLATDPQGSCPPHCTYCPKTDCPACLLGQGSQCVRTTLEEGTSVQKIIEI